MTAFKAARGAALAIGCIGSMMFLAAGQDAKCLKGDDEIAPVLQLHGSGTTNPSKLLWKVMDELTVRAKVPVRLTYRAVGSSTGVREFFGEDDGVSLNDFGSGDIAIDKEKYDTMTGRGQKIFHMPYVMGAISFFHSIPSSLDLDLNACLLARIFNVEIEDWDHPDILAYGTNAELTSVLTGKKIKVVHRVFGSSSTSIATKYLREACPGSWPDNMTGKGDADKTTLEPSKEPYWNVEKTIGMQGSGGVAGYLADNEYAITYLDAGHGNREGFNEVAIANKAGKIVKSTTAVKSAAAENNLSIPDELSADWSAASLLDADGDTSWPMMTFSYFYIHQDMTHLGESGSLVQALVKYVYSDEGQAHFAEFGFAPVPESIRAKALAAIETVALAPGVVSWDFETEGKTQAYFGQKSHIFSGKRGNYNSYLLDHVTGDVAEQFGKLDAKVASLESKTKALDVKPSTASDDDKDGPVAIVALIIAIVCLLAVVAQAYVIAQLQREIQVLKKLDEMKGDNYSIGSGKSSNSEAGLVTNSMTV